MIHRGQLATKFMKALGVAAGDFGGAIAFSESQGASWRDVPQALRAQLAAVSPMGTTDYAPPTPAAFDFAEFIRPLTIIGKLTALRRVPFRVRTIAATSGSSAYWSGEKNPRPISRMTFAGSTLEQLSVTAMVVVTRELFISSAPSAESILSRDLAASAVAAMDSTFIDPSNAGIIGVKPAAITSGGAPGAPIVHSSGITLAAVDNDLPILIQALSDAGSNLLYATWIMRPRTWVALKAMRGSGGARAFAGLTTVRDGGELLGFPVIVSGASPSDIGSPIEGGDLVLLDPSQILLWDDGGGALEVSTNTALAMSDAPTAPSTQVSMFQTESAALKTVRYANWQRCRAGMVQVLDQLLF